MRNLHLALGKPERCLVGSETTSIFNSWWEEVLGLNRLFQVFSWNHRPALPWGILFVLCWVCACGSRKGQLLQMLIALCNSRGTVIVWGSILSVCSILKDTLLGIYPCLNKMNRKNNMFGLDWTNSGWQHGTTSYTHSLRVPWLLVHGTMSRWPACHICLTVARMQIRDSACGRSLAF